MSTCANRRHCISITTSRKKKKCFTSRKRVWAVLARVRGATDCLSRRHEFASAPESGGITQAESKKLQKRLSNGRFYGSRILMCRRARRLLTACRPGAPRANAASGTPDSPLKKNLSESRRNRDAERRRTKNRSNRRQTIRKPVAGFLLHRPVEEVADMLVAASIDALSSEVSARISRRAPTSRRHRVKFKCQALPSEDR